MPNKDKLHKSKYDPNSLSGIHEITRTEKDKKKYKKHSHKKYKAPTSTTCDTESIISTFNKSSSSSSSKSCSCPDSNSCSCSKSSSSSKSCSCPDSSACSCSESSCSSVSDLPCTTKRKECIIVDNKLISANRNKCYQQSGSCKTLDCNVSTKNCNYICIQVNCLVQELNILVANHILELLNNGDIVSPTGPFVDPDGTIVIQNINDPKYTGNEDFLFGSQTLNWQGDNNKTNRLFFIKDGGSFYAGQGQSTWDDSNRGYSNINLGRFHLTSGTGNAAVGGFSNTLGSTAINSVVIGGATNTNNGQQCGLYDSNGCNISNTNTYCYNQACSSCNISNNSNLSSIICSDDCDVNNSYSSMINCSVRCAFDNAQLCYISSSADSNINNSINSTIINSKTSIINNAETVMAFNNNRLTSIDCQYALFVDVSTETGYPINPNNCIHTYILHSNGKSSAVGLTGINYNGIDLTQNPCFPPNSRSQWCKLETSVDSGFTQDVCGLISGFGYVPALGLIDINNSSIRDSNRSLINSSFSTIQASNHCIINASIADGLGVNKGNSAIFAGSDSYMSSFGNNNGYMGVTGIDMMDNISGSTVVTASNNCDIGSMNNTHITASQDVFLVPGYRQTDLNYLNCFFAANNQVYVNNGSTMNTSSSFMVGVQGYGSSTSSVEFKCDNSGIIGGGGHKISGNSIYGCVLLGSTGCEVNNNTFYSSSLSSTRSNMHNTYNSSLIGCVDCGLSSVDGYRNVFMGCSGMTGITVDSDSNISGYNIINCQGYNIHHPNTVNTNANTTHISCTEMDVVYGHNSTFVTCHNGSIAANNSLIAGIGHTCGSTGDFTSDIPNSVYIFGNYCHNAGNSSAPYNNVLLFGGGANSTQQAVAFKNGCADFRTPGGFRIHNGSASESVYAELATDAVTWSFPSDINLKEDLKNIDGSDTLDKLSSLSIYNYKMKNNTNRYIGPVAQEWNSLFGLNDEITRINQNDMIGVCLASIKQLTSRVRELEEKLNI